MKLFQKLLLAPAALGMLTPLAANASESNLKDVSSYSMSGVEVSVDTFKPLSNENPLLAGGEGTNGVSSSQSDFDVDTFSSTTSATFSTNIAVGSVDTSAANDNSLGWNFDWELATSTSFTGNDSLDVVLSAGVSKLMGELDMTNHQDVRVEKISYTTSLGDRTNFFFGVGETAGSSLYNTACVYGAQTDTLSDCGVSAANIDEEFGTATGANFNFGNGFTAALGYEGQGLSNAGFLSDEGADAFGAQVAYTGDNYGVSVSWANIENHDALNALTGSTGSTQSRAVNAYYTPEIENFPSISVGFETSHDDTLAANEDETSHYFVGLQFNELGNGTFGAALGSKAPYKENSNALTMYEVFYSYNYADGITLTPIFYGKENSGSTQNETGIIVKAAYSY